MIFTNFRYIDPEIAESGDGLAPSTAFKDIPSNSNNSIIKVSINFRIITRDASYNP